MSHTDSEFLTPDVWVMEGLQALSELGEPGIKIASIAKRLKVSRGSFYWHFQDRAAYLSAILNEWRRITSNIEEYLDSKGISATEKLGFALLFASAPTPLAPGGPMEQALGQWAAYNIEAAESLTSIQRERLKYIENLFRETGQKEPAIMAEIFYGFIVGSNRIGAHLLLRAPRSAAALELFGLHIERRRFDEMERELIAQLPEARVPADAQ